MRSARPAPLVLALLATLLLTLVPANSATAAKRTSVSVLTFNVCGHAAGCGSWAKREDAVVRRIVASRADVVAIQEGWGVLRRLGQRLAPHGYAFVADSGNEGIFARTSTMAPVTTTTSVTTCNRGRIQIGPEVDTTEWDTSRRHTDDGGMVWTYDRLAEVWFRIGSICTSEDVSVAKSGHLPLVGRASAAWALLQVRRTQKTYLFASVHLTTGKDSVARKRSRETLRLLNLSTAVAEGAPRVFAGDFNSSIQRGKDTVGKRLTAAGFTDAYTRASSRRGTRYNTATGYGRKPRVGGSHIDRVFVPRGASATAWSADVKVRRGKTVRPIPSDHSPVRVTVTLR